MGKFKNKRIKPRSLEELNNYTPRPDIIHGQHVTAKVYPSQAREWLDKYYYQINEAAPSNIGYLENRFNLLKAQDDNL